MGGRAMVAVAVVVAATGTLLPGRGPREAARASALQPAAVGLWSSPFSEDGDGDGSGDFDTRPPQDRGESARLPAAVNAIVLPDGRVLYISQLDGTEDVDTTLALERPDSPGARTRVLDLVRYLRTKALPPGADAWSVPSPEDALNAEFTGADQRHLADGRVLVAGGTQWVNEDEALPGETGRTEIYGRKHARIFDAGTDAWTRATDMTFARYYPSLVTLADGTILAVGGAARLIYNSSLVPGPHPPANAVPEVVRDVERYDPRDERWQLEPASARTSLPPFARLHLLPNGKLLYPAVGMLYPPGAGDSEAATWGEQRWYDPRATRWEDAGAAPFGVRSNAFSVLLPLEPPYRRARVLVGGGTVGPWPSGYVATSLAEIVSWRAGDGNTVQRTTAAPMTSARWHSTAVASPTGEVLVFSGADRDEVMDPGSGMPVRHAEMFDPSTQTWVRLASADRGRTLHNTAVLLADGSVLVGGHAPAPAHYGAHTTNAPGLSSNFKDPSFEIFRPPYLFRGPRPTIRGLSHSVVRWGACVNVDSPDASHPSTTVVLTRLPAVTHAVDADQRTVVLEHRRAGAGRLRVEIPDSRTVLPPGPYYLFLLTDNGQGQTPSVAHIVTVGGRDEARRAAPPRRAGAARDRAATGASRHPSVRATPAAAVTPRLSPRQLGRTAPRSPSTAC